MKILPKFLLVILFASSLTMAHAKKMNYSFEVLIGMADVIVTGQIASILGDTAYLLNISETMKGKPASQIKVKLFQNWACDVRWKKASLGQQLFLCLMKVDDGYETIGGSDGEIFIIDDKLRLCNVFNYPISQYFTEANSPMLSDVISAVKGFIGCYSFINIKGSRFTFEQIKTDAEISVFRNSNQFSIWLFDRVTDLMENYKIKKTVAVVPTRYKKSLPRSFLPAS